MAFSYNEVGPVDPGFTTVSLTFPFLERVHVDVSVDKVVLPKSAWAWNSDTQIELNDPLVGGEIVKAFRTTPAAGVQADFKPGAFDYEELNTSLVHLLYIVQEAYDNSSVAVEAGNNAFAYLMQIEDLVDDANILFSDMQALYTGYDAQADAALVALGNALAAALSAISAARSGALSDITTALDLALGALASAVTTATNAVNALVTQAQGFRNEAEGFKNAAATSATNAANSASNAAASVVGAVKANVAQSFTTPEMALARGNIAAFGAVRIQKFTASGTYTPHAKMVACEVIVVGGGGGGGNYNSVIGAGVAASGGGGGGGGYGRSLLTRAQVGASKPVSIGAAGAAGSGNGGNTTFGTTLVTAGGGIGGQAYTGGSAGGNGGSTGVADIGSPGGSGGNGVYGMGGGGAHGGKGGDSLVGSGAANAVSAAGTSNAGLIGMGFGAGGGGGSGQGGAATQIGGPGTQGICIIIEYCTE